MTFPVFLFFFFIEQLFLIFNQMLSIPAFGRRGNIYSPAAIIRNAKIRNIILLHAFFRTLSSNLDLEYPAVSEENCLENLLPLP